MKQRNSTDALWVLILLATCCWPRSLSLAVVWSPIRLPQGKLSVLVRNFIDVKRHCDHDNLQKDIHLIVAGLQFQRSSPFSPLLCTEVCRQTWCWRRHWEFYILIHRQHKEKLCTGLILSIYEILISASTVAHLHQHDRAYSIVLLSMGQAFKQLFESNLLKITHIVFTSG